MSLSLSSFDIGYSNSLFKGNRFNLDKGDCLCLMGKNGTGKSTLLRVLQGEKGLLSGRCSVDFNNIKSLIAFVGTNRPMLPLTTAKDVIYMGRDPFKGLFSKYSDEDHHLVTEYAQFLNIEDLLEQEFDLLSDGQAQKVLICRALVQDTDFILLDEPTTFLDIPSKLELLLNLLRISKEKKKGVLFTSHDWDLVSKICPEVAIISNGELIQGAPEDLALNGTLDEAFVRPHFFLDSESGAFLPETCSANHIVQIDIEDKDTFNWIKNAVRRHGYTVGESDKVIRYDGVYFSLNENKFVTIKELAESL